MTDEELRLVVELTNACQKAHVCICGNEKFFAEQKVLEEVIRKSMKMFDLEFVKIK